MIILTLAYCTIIIVAAQETANNATQPCVPGGNRTECAVEDIGAPNGDMTECQRQTLEVSSSDGVAPGAFVPDCNEDGLFDSMQCHDSTGECWCVDTETGVETPGSRRKAEEDPPTCEVMTECQRQVAEVTMNGTMPGDFVIVCSADGNFEPMQCDGSTGECFCVDVLTGVEVPGSRKGPDGPPECKVPVLLSQDSPVNVTCSDNEEFTECGSSCEPSCETPAISLCASSCIPNVCECKPGFFRKSGGGCVTASECEALTDCHKEVFAAYSNGLPPPGAFVPSCDFDGTYASLQCHGSTGYCWCVEDSGEEINGTRKGPAEGPVECGDLTKCQIELQAAVQNGEPALGQTVVSCTDDGLYDPMQCHGSTGYCWCVDTETGEELEGTRKGPSDDPPQCYATGLIVDPSAFNCSATEQFAECGNPCEPQCGDPSPTQCGGSCIPSCTCQTGQFRHENGQCVGPEECEAKGPCHEEVFKLAPQLAEGLIGAFVPGCTPDGSYASNQCHGSTGQCWCAHPNGTEIEGTRSGPGEEGVECLSV